MFGGLRKALTLGVASSLSVGAVYFPQKLPQRISSPVTSVCEGNVRGDKGVCGDWVGGFSEEGKFYYYNNRTGESSWACPCREWDSNWDMREPVETKCDDNNGDSGDEKNKKKRAKKACHQIILIRHGEYVSADSDRDRVLTARGREQARLAGRRLQELVDAGTVYPIRRVFYSTMTRATETHGLVQEELKGVPAEAVEPCSMIREGAVCRPNPPHSTWKPSDEDFEKDGLRVQAAFAQHMGRASEGESDSYSTVLVCHGNVIRYFALKALQLPVDAWLRTSVANCSITTLMIHPSGHVSLRGLGDCGHLPAGDVTW